MRHIMYFITATILGCGFVLILSGLADSASAKIATDLSIKYLKPIILSGKENYSNEAFLVSRILLLHIHANKSKYPT